MAKNYWLVKQEPESYSWDTFLQEKGTDWTGVRNFQARNNLRQMRKGDLVLFYHSGDTKAIVGIAKVQAEATPDPTATEGDWASIQLAPVKPLKVPVSLATIKADPTLKKMALVSNSRLSVVPVTPEQYERLLGLGQTKL